MPAPAQDSRTTAVDGMPPPPIPLPTSVIQAKALERTMNSASAQQVAAHFRPCLVPHKKNFIHPIEFLDTYIEH